MRTLHRLAVLGALTCGVASTPALAQDGAQNGTQDQAAPFGGTALSEQALGGIAGREDTVQAATAVQTAGVSRNSVGDNSTTGEARIADNAFQNMSGLSILNVNTGNNVAINAAMNVTISVSPGQ